MSMVPDVNPFDRGWFAWKGDDSDAASRSLLGRRLSTAACVLALLCLGTKGTAQTPQTGYLCGAAKQLCESPETGGAVRESCFGQTISDTWTSPSGLAGDISGTSYTFHLYAATTGTLANFTADVLVDGQAVATTTFSANSNVYTLKESTVAGIDPAAAAGSTLALRVTHTPGGTGFGCIRYGDFGTDDSLVVVPGYAPPPSLTPTTTPTATPTGLVLRVDFVETSRIGLSWDESADDRFVSYELWRWTPVILDASMPSGLLWLWLAVVPFCFLSRSRKSRLTGLGIGVFIVSLAPAHGERTRGLPSDATMVFQSSERTQTNFIDTGVQANRAYAYQLFVRLDGAASAESNIVEARTLPLPTPTASPIATSTRTPSGTPPSTGTPVPTDTPAPSSTPTQTRTPGAGPMDGTYAGTTSQGEAISIVVEGGEVTSASVAIACPGFSSGVIVGLSCAITDNSFNCSNISTGCIPFVPRLQLAGTFDTATSVNGTFTIQYRPDQFASCCTLSDLSWSAALP